MHHAPQHDPGRDSSSDPKDLVTRILQDGSADDAAQVGELLPIVYRQLRAAAQHQLLSERPGQTLQATALVHEAFLKLVGPREVPWQSRGHFYAAAAEAMRQILIDHARAKAAHKRGGSARRVPLTDYAAALEADPDQTLALGTAISRLEEHDQEGAAVVRLRFFAGLTGEQTAQALGMSPRKVDLVWARARAWLFRALKDAPENKGT